MTILSKGCKPNNVESNNSLKLSFLNIWGLRSNFVECEFFVESNSREIIALCETNLDNSNDSGNFSVRVYLALIQRVLLLICMILHFIWRKDRLPFARNLFLENYGDSYLCFWLDLLHSVSCFFFLYRSLSSSLCTVFDAISSNIDGILLINPSANVSLLETLTSIISTG